MTLGGGNGGSARSRPRQLRAPRARRSARSIVLRTFAVLVAVALVGGSLVAYLSFRADWNDVRRINVLKDLGTHRPPPDPNALNILLIGSDSRAGQNRKFGATVQGQRSDTIMILHIAPGAHQVDVISIPRDTVVPIFGCSPEPGAPGQTAEPAGYVEQINATFAYGGPGCLWKTIEQTTGIHLNDFIELTFTGFEHVIDDIGGVNVCLPVPVRDADSGLYLSAGRHHVWGREALAFWRARYIGEGSDLQRIRRDQFLMASLLQGIERSGLLHSPSKILSVIRDVVGHQFVTTDTQLTLGRIVTIAENLRSLSSKSVQFVEVPTIPYPGNPAAWVEWEQPQDDALFSAIIHDTKLPRAHKAGRHVSGGAAALDSVSPAQIDVTVLNGTTVSGLAAATAADLTARGFDVVGPPADAASDAYPSSVIEYASKADLPAAETLAHLIKDVTLKQNTSLTPGTVQLILGASFTGLAATASPSASASPSPSASPTSGTSNLAGKYGGITGNVAICNDASAFAGPDGQ
jgi:LCP family protein required for cell wall assembly